MPPGVHKRADMQALNLAAGTGAVGRAVVAGGGEAAAGVTARTSLGVRAMHTTRPRAREAE